MNLSHTGFVAKEHCTQKVTDKANTSMGEGGVGPLAKGVWVHRQRGCGSIGVARGPCPTKCLENLVIFFFERRYPKQYTVV